MTEPYSVDPETPVSQRFGTVRMLTGDNRPFFDARVATPRVFGYFAGGAYAFVGGYVIAKVWRLVVIALTLLFGASLNGAASAKPRDHCIDVFQASVFQLQPGKTSSVRGYPVAPASRNLLVPNASDIPSSLLTCAVAANDQMALLIRGRQLLAEPASAEDVVEGLRLISMAAYPQNQESIDCRIVTRALGYSCPTGLPEAHLEIGRLFANCKSDLYQPTLAKQHLSHALLSGARGASEAIADLEHGMTRPIEAGCTRSPR